MIYCFDLDGTLIDSRRRHTEVLRCVLEKNAVICTQEKIAAYVPYKAEGKRTVEFLREVLGLEPSLAEKCAAQWVEAIEEEKYIEGDVLYEDTLAVLRELQDRGTIVCLTARRVKAVVLAEMKRLGISAYMNKVFVVSPFRAKLEKQAVVRSLKRRDEVMLIGDTEIEYAVAQEENVEGKFLHCGFRSKAFWERRQVVSYPSLRDAMM